MKRKKKVIAIVAIVLAVLTVAGTVAGIVFTQKKTNNEPAGEGLSSTHDELFVKEIFGKKVEDIVDDPELKDHLVNTTENYVMLDSDAFDLPSRLMSATDIPISISLRTAMRFT